MGVYMDNYSALGLGLAIIPIISWIFISTAQHRRLKDGLFRVQVLSARTALMLPSYAILIWITLYEPRSTYIMSFPIAIAEGFSFYSFFAMLIENLGGGEYAVQEMKAVGRPPCGCCSSVDHRKFYSRVRWALFQFLFIRPLVELGTAIFHYVDNKPLFLICTFVAVVQFLFGFIYLVSFYDNVYQLSGNLHATLKIFLLKVSVGLYITQGVVVDVLVTTNTLHPHGNDSFNSDQRVTRGLALLVLIEYTLMSLVLYLSFSHAIDINTSTTYAPLQSNVPVEISYSSYVFHICKFLDVFQHLAPKKDYSVSFDSTERLLMAQNQHKGDQF